MVQPDKQTRQGPKHQAMMRRRQGKKQDIVNLAAELMRHSGYAGVSLKAVADKMKVTEPALYYYFKSKEDLLYAIVNQTVDETLASMEELVQQQMPATVKLQHIIRSFTGLIVDRLPMFTTYFQDKGHLSRERVDEISKKERRFVQLIVDVIEQGKQSGECHLEQDALVTAFAMIGASAWAYKWYLPEGRLTPEQLAQQIARLCLEGCLTDRGQHVLHSATPDMPVERPS